MSRERLENIQLDLDEFFSIRADVTATWPTGKDVDLQEAMAYHLQMPKNKNLALVMRNAKAQGEVLTQPRGGVALLEDHLDLLLCLQNDGGADILPTTTDSYTRNERFKDAGNGIEESKKRRRSMLNGLPVVNYGVKRIQTIIEKLDRPAILLSGSPFPRLTAEIAFAAGFTGFLGSGIAYTASYSKELPIEQGIRNYQYVDRLVAYYNEHGIHLHREQPGFLTGTLIPPGISIAVSVLDTLLAAGQGVTHYNVGIGQNLTMLQDVAALKVLVVMCQEYLKRFGYLSVFQAAVSHQWMGAFPPDEAEAYAVISLGGVIAVLGNATQLVTKTPHEALGIPTKEANAGGLRATKRAINCMHGFRLPDGDELAIEMDVITQEVRAIVDKVLELGDGDAAVGTVRSIQAGVLDIPWSPNLEMANNVMPARDVTGAIRYLDPGNLPLSKEVTKYHRERLMQRAKREKRDLGIGLAIDDIYEISRLAADRC